MSEQKMREALERIASEEVKNLGSARILAREALAQQPAAVVELTDDRVVITVETLDAMMKLVNAANELDHHAEEYDFDDGMGRGAAQCFWDDFSRALIDASDVIAKQGGAA